MAPCPHGAHLQLTGGLQGWQLVELRIPGGSTKLEADFHHVFQEPPTSKLQLSRLFTSLKPLNQCAPVSKHDEVSGTKWAHVRVGIYPCKVGAVLFITCECVHCS